MKESFQVSRDVREILEKLKEEEKRPPGLYERISHLGHKLFKGITKDMELTEEKLRQLAWAGYRLTPSEWWSGFLFLLLTPIILALIGFIIAIPLGFGILSIWYLPLTGFILGGLLSMTFYSYPASLEGLKKTDAQAKAIETTMLLSFALHHRSDLRGAVVFAANSSEGKLAEDLQKGLLELDQKHNYESVRQLLVSIAHKWREIDEGARRAIFDILRSTGQRDEAARRQDVAKAPQRVLQSSEEQLDTRLDDLVMPTMTFMVFGSLAIVGVIGLSPVFGLVGLNFIDLKFFALVAIGLVVAFLAFTTYIGRQRPATIPPPKIPSDDPRVPPEGKARVLGFDLPLLLIPILVGGIITIPGLLYFAGIQASNPIIESLNSFWIIWGVAAGISTYAYLRVGPRAKIRDENRKETRDWSMALNTMGSFIIDGRPMHQAMKETSNLMGGTGVSDQLKEMSSTMERFSTTARDSLFQRGVIERIYNPLIVTMLDVITQIKRSSESAAGHACMMAANFLDTLHEVEQRFRKRVGDATSNLWMMAVILLPIVCALSVWVMEFLSGISLTISSQAASAGLANFPFVTVMMETSELVLLKLIMGLTAIALGIVVIRHIAVIRAGRDPVEFWKSVAPTVISITIVFTIAYIGLGFLNVTSI
ncbi:MAG: hypothetical protein KGY45_03830 [Hadesarchaea archaeon]|nr:hypothetical protein [Hadesarchaea archaeon]